LRKFDILSEARIDKVERPSNFANQKTLPFFSCFLTSLSHGKKTREGWGAIEMGLVGWYWRRVKLGESREGPAWFFFFVEETSFFHEKAAAAVAAETWLEHGTRCFIANKKERNVFMSNEGNEE
jgi:hypothetical protein